MKKPAIFRILEWLGGRLSARNLWRLFRYTVIAFLLRTPRVRRAMRSYLRRILTYQEKPADAATIDRLISETGDFYSQTLVSISVLPRLRPRLGELVSLELLPTLERLRALGKGVILATPHFGDLYLAIPALADSGIKLSALMLGAENFAWIGTENLSFIPIGSGALALLSALERNETALVFTDIDYFPGERTAELFGAPVYPPQGAARLSQASGAPVLPMYAVYERGRHRLRCGEPILPEEAADHEDIERRLLRSMEEFLGAHPAQWLVFQDLWDLKASLAYNQGLYRQAAR